MSHEFLDEEISGLLKDLKKDDEDDFLLTKLADDDFSYIIKTPVPEIKSPIEEKRMEDEFLFGDVVPVAVEKKEDEEEEDEGEINIFDFKPEEIKKVEKKDEGGYFDLAPYDPGDYEVVEPMKIEPLPPVFRVDEEERRKKREMERRMKSITAKKKKVMILRKEYTRREFIRRIRKSQNVDLVFLVDCTGTMQAAINKVKMNCMRITEVVLQSFKRFKMRCAFVGYRDFEARKGVKEAKEKRFEILPLGPVERLKPFLEKIRASGGGDTAEDVFGGLEKVQEMEFHVDYPTRLLVHLADAPAHGMEYHDEKVEDYYPRGDPEGRDVKKLLGFLRTLRIHYFFVQIDDPFCEHVTTDKMIQKFKGIYEKENKDEMDELKLEVFSEHQDYLKLFIKAVNASISSSINYAKFIRMGKEKGDLGLLDKDPLFD